MEESLKNRLILILAILTVIFFLGTVHSCGAANRLKMALIDLDKEKAANWEAEQRLSELKQQKAALAEQLEATKTEDEASKKALSQEQLVNQTLKEELEKTTKLKEKLEEDLKEALVRGKSKK